MTQPAIPPPQWDPERRARLVELGEWHDQWQTDRLDVGGFAPDGQGPDYNVHTVDVEADNEAFHARARNIVGLT